MTALHMVASMTVRSSHWWLIILAVAGCGTPAQAQDLSAVVQQFFPSSLRDGVDFVEHQCHAVWRTDGQGPALLIAGYASGTLGEVRVIARSANEWSVVSAPTGDEFAGESCNIDLVDVDGDGSMEAHVQFAVRSVTTDWIYRWTGTQIVSMTPTTPQSALGGNRTTNLMKASLFDLDGDGALEIVSTSSPPQDPDEPVVADEIYALGGGTEYGLDRRIVGLWYFERTQGTPSAESRLVRVPTGASGPFSMRVLNGAGLASTTRVENAAESGRIWLNGQELVSPQHFGHNVPLIERTITLQADNELRVRLGGAPGGRIVIVIDAANWTP